MSAHAAARGPKRIYITYTLINYCRKLWPKFDYKLSYKSLGLGTVRHHFIVVVLGRVIVAQHQSFGIYVSSVRLNLCGKLKSSGISFGRNLKYINLEAMQVLVGLKLTFLQRSDSLFILVPSKLSTFTHCFL